MTSMHGTFHSFLANKPLLSSAAPALTWASGARLLRENMSMAAETRAPAVSFVADAASDTVSMAKSVIKVVFEGADEAFLEGSGLYRVFGSNQLVLKSKRAMTRMARSRLQ